MSRVQPHQLHSGKFQRDGRSSYTRTSNMGMSTNAGANYICNYDYHAYNTKLGTKNQESYCFSQNYGLDGRNYDCAWPDSVPSSKKRKISALSCESTGRPYQHQYTYQNDLVNHADQRKPLGDYNTYYDAHLIRNSSAVVETRSNNASVYASTTSKRDRSKFEDDEVVFMSRDEIERCSPSRKDGIDPLHETYLRYTYCAFLQNLGVSLDLPQTTIGTAMVLCHRFFVRRSHASHDRFLIATAVLFLASKSEETPCLLNDVIRLSGQILQKQDVTLLSYKLPTGWFEQYRERITEAEQLILTTLNFELNVQHPFESLNSTLQKLGFQQSVLVNLALSLVGEGIKDSIGSTCGMTTETVLEIKDYWLLYELINLQEPMPAIFEQDDKLRSSLWLQFKPHQIAAGAAYLAAKFLNMNLASCHDVWHEFHTTPSVLKDVAHQLMELF